MKLLALETSTQVCAAAVLEDERLLADYRTNLKNVHAVMIFRQIDCLLRDVGLSAGDLAGIAVSIGPGSFTGLRIGLSAAKGLAFAHRLPLVGVPSLQSLIADVAVENGRMAVVRRARLDEYYAAVYERRDWQDSMTEGVRVLSRQSLLDCLPVPCFLAGEVDEFIGKTPTGCTILPNERTLPCAYRVGRIGLQMIRNRQVIDLDHSEPLYHQEFIAVKPLSAP